MDGEWWRRFLLEFVKSLEFIWIFATGVITGLTDGISWANVCEMTGASLNWKIIICIPAFSQNLNCREFVTEWKF